MGIPVFAGGYFETDQSGDVRKKKKKNRTKSILYTVPVSICYTFFSFGSSLSLS